MHSRGLSQIVASVLIVLIVLVASAMMWVGVKTFLNQTSTIGGKADCVALQLQPVSCSYDNVEHKVAVNVHRDSNLGSSDLSQLNFIFSTNSGSYIINQSASLKELETQRYVFDIDPNKVPITVDVAGSSGGVTCSPSQQFVKCGLENVEDLTQCSDGIDNDGDGWIDFVGVRKDPSCANVDDDDESDQGYTLTQCSDGIDNADPEDALADGNDLDCTDWTDTSETTQGGGDPIKDMIKLLVHGGNAHTLRVLYMGNSRVARGTGYAYDGIEEIAYDANRLAGNGFVIPAYKLQQPNNQNQEKYLSNFGKGMVSGSQLWWDVNDAGAVLNAYPFSSTSDTKWGLQLGPGKILQMASLFSGTGISVTKSMPVEITIQYLVGPGRGKFSITPIVTNPSNGYSIVSQGTSLTIDTNAAANVVQSQKTTLPALQNQNYDRSFLLTEISGTSIIYRANAIGDVLNGIAISDMGVGGEGYKFQTDPTKVPADASWKAYVSAYNPDVIIWQYANNQLDNNANVVAATKTLMDRASVVNPNVIHVIMTEAPTPGDGAQQRLDSSYTWANSLKGYKGAIVVDTAAYLPQDFLKFKASCDNGVDDGLLDSSCTYPLSDYSQYFITTTVNGVVTEVNTLHENANGARIVANAVWTALTNYADH